MADEKALNPPIINRKLNAFGSYEETIRSKQTFMIGHPGIPSGTGVLRKYILRRRKTIFFRFRENTEKSLTMMETSGRCP